MLPPSQEDEVTGFFVTVMLALYEIEKKGSKDREIVYCVFLRILCEHLNRHNSYPYVDRENWRFRYSQKMFVGEIIPFFLSVFKSLRYL